MAAYRYIVALFLVSLLLISVCESRNIPKYEVLSRSKRSPLFGLLRLFGLGRRGLGRGRGGRGGRGRRGGRRGRNRRTRRITGGLINPNPFSRPDRGIFPSQPLLI
ncbi:UNVERIFIED_CONTAM: hypothetical protein RMT77_009921 [Armadillidium vulgare]